MERGLRDCCRALRIGKILITASEEFGQVSEPRVVYAKLPPGIESRKILLMYPTLSKLVQLISSLHYLHFFPFRCCAIFDILLVVRMLKLPSLIEGYCYLFLFR